MNLFSDVNVVCDGSAFENCTDLKSVSIPKSVLTISQCAFYGCGSLESVSYSNGLKTIGFFAFYKCSSLKKISIPSSVDEIGFNAFSACVNLTNITFKGTKAEWDEVNKYREWCTGAPATVVHCTDGDVEI